MKSPLLSSILFTGCTGLTIVEKTMDSAVPLDDSIEKMDTGMVLDTGVEDTDEEPEEEPEERDFDGDGYSPEEGDCDDLNPEIYPTQTDRCDGIDNNCDGEIDEGAVGAYYEPNDTFWNGANLGEFSAGDSLDVQGIIPAETDIDIYELYVEDGWFDNFAIDFELHSIGPRADFVIELWLIENASGYREDLLLSVNNLTGGGIERGAFYGNIWTDDTGYYEFRISALSGQDCDALYDLNILISP